MTDFVVINGETLPANTGAECEAIAYALGRAGIDKTQIYRSPTDDVWHPDTIKLGLVLLA